MLTFGEDACLPRRNEYCVYVLQYSDNSFYIGQTDNFARRIEEHKSGKGAEWVKKGLPFEAIHWEVFSTRSEAVKREGELKTGFGRKWLKREYKKDALAASRRRQVELPLCRDAIYTLRIFYIMTRSFYSDR